MRQAGREKGRGEVLYVCRPEEQVYLLGSRIGQEIHDAEERS